jgi:hypothetical protein
MAAMAARMQGARQRVMASLLTPLNQHGVDK